MDRRRKRRIIKMAIKQLSLFNLETAVKADENGADG